MFRQFNAFNVKQEQEEILCLHYWWPKMGMVDKLVAEGRKRSVNTAFIAYKLFDYAESLKLTL